MPVTTKGAPYPSGSDDPDVPDDMRLLAQHYDTRLPQAQHWATVTVNVSAAVSGTVAVTFPASLFAGSPRVIVAGVGTTAYGFSASAVTATGCNVTARHLDNTSATATVTGHLVAAYN